MVLRLSSVSNRTNLTYGLGLLSDRPLQMKFIKRLLCTRFGVWLGLYPIFAANEEDRQRIIEAAEFQPNDVY